MLSAASNPNSATKTMNSQNNNHSIKEKQNND